MASDGLNKVMLLGNLCQDGELRSTSGGQAVLKLRIATNESYLDRDKQRKERVEYHTCVVWGKRAEALSRILTKGSRVFIEGGLRTSSYDDKDGNKRYKTEIVATNIILCGGKRGEDGAAPSSGDYNPDDATAGEGSGRDDDFPF